ncbi:MAG: DUF3073 domain-containing protein [Candidatus Nanopelagicales bacterium]
MGRGRAKAKQTKVARQLKYSSPDTDLEALRAELSGGSSDSSDSQNSHDSSDEYSDKYDPYADYNDEK